MGPQLWEVQWCEEFPVDEDGDGLWDEIDWLTKYFKTYEAALRYAKEVFPKDALGVVSIHECHEEPIEPECPQYGSTMEYDADPEYIHEEDCTQKEGDR